MPDEKLKERPMTPRQRMRALIARRGYTMAPGAYDTLTARLVEQAGFDAVYLTGGGYSRANGYPDLGLLTLSENVRFIGLTVDAVGIPVGADAGFVEAPQNVEELQIVARQVKGPALANVFEGGKTPMVSASELEAMGFRLGIYPSQTHRAAIRAAQKVLAALKEDGDTSRIESDLATFQEREDAVGTARWRTLEEKYMWAG